MIDGLAAIVAVVDDYAVAFGQPSGAGDLCRRQEKMTKQIAVGLSAFGERDNMFARSDQDVHRRLRMNVWEGVAQFVLINGGGGNASFNNLAKDAAHDGTSVQEFLTTP